MLKKLLTLGAVSAFLFSFAQQKLSIISSVGYAWRTAEMPKGISAEERNYLKGLKTGMNFDVSAYYHLKGDVALGLKYSNYSASNNGKISVIDNNWNVVSGVVHTKDNITFFGPALMYSNFNQEIKHKLFLDLALGVISYTTKTGGVKGTGSNLGVEMNMGYQYALAKNVFIGPKLGLTGGTLNKMKFNGVTYEFGEDQKEGLGRVSLSAAATFHF